jgi:hypothetical protein
MISRLVDSDRSVTLPQRSAVNTGYLLHSIDPTKPIPAPDSPLPQIRLTDRLRLPLGNQPTIAHPPVRRKSQIIHLPHRPIVHPIDLTTLIPATDRLDRPRKVTDVNKRRFR